MRKTPITLALAAAFVAFTPAAHADVTYSFTNLTFEGFQFLQPYTALYGTLTGVSVTATLLDSFGFTFANDLAIYVAREELNGTPLLQVGGFTDVGAPEYHEWANGNSSATGTVVNSSVSLTTPITFSGAGAVGNGKPTLWLGNGYSGSGSSTSGTWTGSITLRGVSATPPVTAVPEPSTYGMLALGGLGMAAWFKRRRKGSATAA